jgi:hypothetical protein
MNKQPKWKRTFDSLESLASKAGAFMTGQAIVIDGGATI